MYFTRTILAAITTATLLLPSIARAEEATITIKKSDTTSMAIKPFAGADGANATKIVQNDLDLSSLFSLAPADRASYTVTGSASGSTLDGVVTDNRGSVVLKKSYPGGTRPAAHKFSDDIVETIAGTKGIASTKIAFVSSSSGHKEICLADYDGANASRLTNDGVISVHPAISWDGTKIAYTGYQAGYADIYLIDLASKSRRPIVRFPGTNSGAAFAPDGLRIACTMSKDGNPELYVAGVNGGTPRRLTNTRGVEASPSWAPSGNEIIYSSDDRGTPQLYRIGAGGGSGRPVSTGFGYCTEPSWSPDGKKIAFNVRQGGFSIAVTDLATGATRIVADGENPCWGADSRHLIFSTGSSINMIDTLKGRIVPIITGQGKVSEPSWSR